MKKTLLTGGIVIALACSASAQSTSTDARHHHLPHLHGNASDWNIPPYVIKYLRNHPKVAKKVIAYYKEHGQLPPFPTTPGVTAATTQVQMAANVQWPTAPAAPAAIPVAAK